MPSIDFLTADVIYLRSNAKITLSQGGAIDLLKSIWLLDQGDRHALLNGIETKIVPLDLLTIQRKVLNFLNL